MSKEQWQVEINKITNTLSTNAQDIWAYIISSYKTNKSDRQIIRELLGL